MALYPLPRRGFIAGSATSLLPFKTHAQDTAPLLGRINAATVGCTDLTPSIAHYEDLLDYRVVEEGAVPTGLAVSWGTPMSIGRRYAVLQPATGAEVFVRLVEIDGIDGFQALTTPGWSSLEYVAEHPDDHLQTFKASSLAVLGEPRQLPAFPRIRAMQIKGPDEVMWHLTSETEDWDTSILAHPGGPIGGIFPRHSHRARRACRHRLVSDPVPYGRAASAPLPSQHGQHGPRAESGHGP